MKGKLLTAAVVLAVLAELGMHATMLRQKRELRGEWPTLEVARQSEQAAWLPKAIPAGATALVGHHDLDRNSTRGLFTVEGARPGAAEPRPRSFSRGLEQAQALFADPRGEQLRSASRLWSTCADAESGGSTWVAVDLDSGAGLYWTSSDSCRDGR